MAAPALHLLQGVPIFGDDHSSHMVTVFHLLALIRAGETDLFCPTFNLGFPMYLYYQPLPHFAAALVHIVTLRALDVQTSFNLTVVVLWSLYPLALYLGARKLGLGQASAMLCALVAPTVSSSLPFGLTLHSIMGLGLYTQLYGMVLLPLCVGTTWHAIQVQHRPALRAVLLPAGLMVLLWLCHAFYGMAAATVAIVMTLVVPSAYRRTVPRLMLMGLLTVASLLFWLIPLALTRDSMGGWPWGGQDRWQGYGLVRVGSDLLWGRVLDHGRLPVLTVGLAAGLLVGLWRLRGHAICRALVLCLGLFVLFLMGRRTFGHLVDIQPANLGLQLFRYIGPVHLLSVLLSGYGIFWLLRRLSTRLPVPAVLLAAALLLAAPVHDLWRRCGKLFVNMDDYSIKPAQLAAAGRAVDSAHARGAAPGRVYSHGKTGHGSHLVAALMARHTRQPMGQNYGVSLHDSLGFYYLEYLDPLDPGAMALYNFRYVLARPHSAFAIRQHELGNPPIFGRGKLLVYLLPGDHGYFQPVDLPLTLVGSPRGIRLAARKWIASGWPTASQYGQIVTAPAAAQGSGHLVLEVHNERVKRRRGRGLEPLAALPPVPRHANSPGRVLHQHTGYNRYEARVKMRRPGALALKVAFHPFWTVQVDQRPRPLLQLTPGFLGVRVPAGEHTISFRYRNPYYQKLLLLLTLAGWSLAILWGLWSRRI